MGLAHSSGHAAAYPFTWWPLKYQGRVVCLSSLLSSSPHQHGHNLKPQALLAPKQSCLTQSAHIPPVAVDSYTDSSRDPHTRRRVLFLSHSSDGLASLQGLPALCQSPCRRYLFFAWDGNRRGIFPSALQKWMEFSCSFSGWQFHSSFFLRTPELNPSRTHKNA